MVELRWLEQKDQSESKPVLQYKVTETGIDDVDSLGEWRDVPTVTWSRRNE